MGYIGVEDVDAATSRVIDRGGTVLRSPDEIPGVGRFSVVADPQGAALNLFKPQPRTSEPTSAYGAAGGTRNGPAAGAADGIAGSICWRELNTTDLEAADAFYSSLFGWSKGEAIDMGETGTYQILTDKGLPFGGMMIKSQEAPVPCWSFYFSVDGVGAAVERVREHGGRTLYGPSQVAGGGWIAMCFDPQGALFGVASTQS